MLTFLDPAEEATFAREGYIVRRVLTDEQVAAALGILDEWSQIHYGSDLSGLPSVAKNGLYFSELERDRAIREDLEKRLFPVVDAAFRRGTTGAEPRETGIAVKLANETRLRLHQHPPMLLDTFARYVLSWCSLIDTDVNNGCLLVIPRSHSLYRQIEVPGEEPFFISYEAELIEKFGKPLPLKAGEAVYFDNLLLHGSYSNALSATRPAILTSFLGKGVQKVSCRRASDGAVEFVADSREVYNYYKSELAIGNVPDERVLKRLPAWNRKATLEEMAILLESDLRPSEDFCPLEFLCGPEVPAPVDGPVTPKRNLLVRVAARVLPGWVKRPIRRMVDGLRGTASATAANSGL